MSLYSRGVDFIKDMHRMFDELEGREMPVELKEHFDKISHYIELLYGSLAKGKDYDAAVFCMLQNISDPALKDFDVAGVEAMAKLLTANYYKKAQLQAKLEHLRWLFDHVQSAMKE